MSNGEDKPEEKQILLDNDDVISMSGIYDASNGLGETEYTVETEDNELLAHDNIMEEEMPMGIVLKVGTAKLQVLSRQEHALQGCLTYVDEKKAGGSWVCIRCGTKKKTRQGKGI